MQKQIRVFAALLTVSTAIFSFVTHQVVSRQAVLAEESGGSTLVDTSFIRAVHGSEATEIGTVLGFSGYEWNTIGYNGEGISYQESVDYLGGTEHLVSAGKTTDKNAILIQRNVPSGNGHVDNINTWRYRSSPGTVGTAPDPNPPLVVNTGAGVTLADIGVTYVRHLPRDARYGNEADNPDWYYAGSYVSNPNEYGNSTLQRRFEQLAADESKFPAEQAAYVVPRSFSALGQSGDLGFAGYVINRDSVDHITKTFVGTSFSTVNGGDNPAGNVLNQKLWAISEPEAAIVNNGTVMAFPNTQMTRSPNANNPNQNSTISTTGLARGSQAVNNANRRIRPSLTLDMSDVLFASSYDGSIATTKSQVGVGSFQDVLVDKTQVELTMLDDTKTLVVSGANQNGSCSIDITYNSATVGDDHFVSAILVDGDGGLVRYGKLADTSESASGTATLTFGNGGLGGGGIADGTYKVVFFSEEVNGDKYLDFAGPLNNELEVTIDGGLVTSVNLLEIPELANPDFVVSYQNSNIAIIAAVVVVSLLSVSFLYGVKKKKRFNY